MQKKELKVGDGSTEYIILKRCCNCFEICEHKHTSCPQCSYTFIREATPTEVEISARKILDLEDKKEIQDLKETKVKGK